jgi:hypothetical protein
VLEGDELARLLLVTDPDHVKSLPRKTLEITTSCLAKQYFELQAEIKVKIRKRDKPQRIMMNS